MRLQQQHTLPAEVNSKWCRSANFPAKVASLPQLSDDMSNSSMVPLNMSSSMVPLSVSYRPPVYVPSNIVLELHAYFHYGGANEFDPGNSDYQLAMAGFFALPLAVGIMLTVGFGAFQFCASKCPRLCCCCLPKRRNWTRQRRLVSISLVLNMALLCCCWIGRNELQSGASRATKLISNNETGQKAGLVEDFVSLDLHARALGEAANSTRAAVAVLVREGCPRPDPMVASSIQQGALDQALYERVVVPAMEKLGASGGNAGGSGEASAGDESGMLSQLTSAAAQIEGMFAGIGTNLALLTKVDLELYVDIALGMFVGKFGLGLLAAMVGLLCVSQCMIALALGNGTTTMLAVSGAVAMEVFVSVLLSDFCVAQPLKAIDTLAQNYLQGMPATLAHYYTTCEGNNPIGTSLQMGLQGLTALENQLNSLGNLTYASGQKLCRETSVAPLMEATGRVSRAMDGIIEAMSCARINPLLTGITHELLCHDVVHGTYHLWVVKASAAVMLFFNLQLLWRVKYCLARPSEFPRRKTDKDSAVVDGTETSGRDANAKSGPLGSMKRRIEDKSRINEEKAMQKEKIANTEKPVAQRDAENALVTVEGDGVDIKGRSRKQSAIALARLQQSDIENARNDSSSHSSEDSGDEQSNANTDLAYSMTNSPTPTSAPISPGFASDPFATPEEAPQTPASRGWASRQRSENGQTTKYQHYEHVFSTQPGAAKASIEGLHASNNVTIDGQGVIHASQLHQLTGRQSPDVVIF